MAATPHAAARAAWEIWEMAQKPDTLPAAAAAVAVPQVVPAHKAGQAK
jgi:hypothetical protein